MICGDYPVETSYFPYRSSFYITRFFSSADTDHTHDGSTRARWVSATLEKILLEPHANAQTPPDSFCRVIQNLMDPADASNEGPERLGALEQINIPLRREGFEAFYAEDHKCYLRHVGTNTVVSNAQNPYRPFTKLELDRRQRLTDYLDICSEDDLIAEVLLPLFRQLGFHRITSTGHKDKALEYGKDVWMKYTLPTFHVIYFGLQAKKGKLDAAGMSKGSNLNIAEILNQTTMMLGHEVFDAETNKKALVDHAFIVAGGEITKAAKNWLGERLDHSKRSQIIFMDREDIMNLFIVNNLPLPSAAIRPSTTQNEDDLPF